MVVACYHQHNGPATDTSGRGQELEPALLGQRALLLVYVIECSSPIPASRIVSSKSISYLEGEKEKENKKENKKSKKTDGEKKKKRKQIILELLALVLLLVPFLSLLLPVLYKSERVWFVCLVAAP